MWPSVVAVTSPAFPNRAVFITGAERPASPLHLLRVLSLVGLGFSLPRHQSPTAIFQGITPLISPALCFHRKPPRWFPHMCCTATYGRTDRGPSSWVRPPSDQWQPCEGVAHTPMHGIVLASLCSKDREKCACITLDACTGLQPKPFHHYSFHGPRPDRQQLPH